MQVISIIALALVVGVCFLIVQGGGSAAHVAMIGFFSGSVVLYFSPTIIAFSRSHPNRVAITVLNIFLGWTVIGWVGALVWAYTSKSEVIAEVIAMPTPEVETLPPSVVEVSPQLKKCPFCAEDVRAEAIKCKHCGSDISARA